jgi:hypothetical protein
VDYEYHRAVTTDTTSRAYSGGGRIAKRPLDGGEQGNRPNGGGGRGGRGDGRGDGCGGRRHGGDTTAIPCTGCGNVHPGTPETCAYRGTKWFNWGKTKWIDSRQAADLFKSKENAAKATGKDTSKWEKPTCIPGKPEDQEKAAPRQGTSLSLV